MCFSSQTQFIFGHAFISYPFLCLFVKLLDTCNMENANTNLKKVDTMSFWKLKHYL